MTEAEKHEELEFLCGGPERAFRLRRLHTACVQSSRENVFFPSTPTAEERFSRRAKEERYSEEAITAFLDL